MVKEVKTYSMSQGNGDLFKRPRIFLEEDCPVQELGIECQREGGVGLHPPVNRLHVWWARRPLTISRAAILGSLLPAEYPKDQFLKLMGIFGDAVGGRKKVLEVQSGIRKERVKDPYGYPRAFTYTPNKIQLNSIREDYNKIWGTKNPTILDSFAGGGSIPFEAFRVGCDVISNELNPVACVTERATIEYPSLFGNELAHDLEYFGQIIQQEIEMELKPCFPRLAGETELCYIWVRTVSCPQCELDVPLAPNFWLDTANNIGFKPMVPQKEKGNTCTFEIKLLSSEFDPEKGTITRGVGSCPRCPAVLDGEYIKTEAQAGRMGHQLAAVGFKIEGKSGRHFRIPTQMDLEGVILAEKKLKQKLPFWEKRGLVPNEEIPEGAKTSEPRRSGILRWRDMFAPRQLFVHLTTLEKILDLPWNEINDPKKREALRVYIQLAFNKCLNYSAILNLYDPSRLVVKNVFARHDFAFTWSYGEIDGAGFLFRFGINQINDAYKEISKLITGNHGTVQFLNGDAANLSSVKSKSVTLVVIDPPYYNNVMYSDLSDFFYVWMKRGLGDVFPQYFQSELTDKDAEAVANVARFKEMGAGKARKLADQDYEAKMLAAFKECNRVLRDDGVLTIMFTHKKVEAWDTLAMAIINAGFSITASWPIHTESEHSLHQAKKNAAASTILLICRKRLQSSSAWWEDIIPLLDKHVKERAEEFERRELRGQDTFIACFGPALQIISEKWPVKTKDGRIIRPDEALDRARTVVSEWFMDRIAEGKAKAVDPPTRFYILAWFLFGAREFPFDEARKLGFSLGVDVETLVAHKILTKKGDSVKISKPSERARTTSLHPDARSYDWDIDYVQRAMYAYETGQTVELNRFHQRTGALTRDGYKQAISYLLDVLPRTEEVVEYHLLNEMWNANLRDQVHRRTIPRTATLDAQTKLEDHNIDKEHNDEETS